VNPYSIFYVFYPENTPLRRLLLHHSEQVRDKALAIAALPRNADLPLNRETVIGGALLHDIGVGRCHAPSILCEGLESYLRHGLIGGALLREYGAEHGLDLERFARICERHTGSGLAAAEIRRENLPLPVQDFLPETPEEKLICLADKFFSKSGSMQEKSLDSARRSLMRFGEAPLARLDDLCSFFHVS